jgi:RHS repeat-associated protein
MSVFPKSISCVPVQDSYGDITKVFNGVSGAPLFNANYSPFGDRAITLNQLGGNAEGSAQPLSFTGAEQDQAYGLVYMRNRYYAPGLGRFISEDPVGFGSGSNFYAYCGNDPINFSDPLGLYSVRGFVDDMSAFGPDSWKYLNDPHVWADGLDTGLHNMLVGVTAGFYDGGAYRCKPGAELSRILGEIGRSALFEAASLHMAQGRSGLGDAGDLGRGGQLEMDLGVQRNAPIHGNSLDNPDPGHVYAIFDKDNKSIYKFGESSGDIKNIKGIDKSARAEVQVRKLNKGLSKPIFRSRIIAKASDKSSEREIETRLIRMFKEKHGVRPAGNPLDR